MTKYKIYNEDVIDWCKRYNKIKFHALLSDPPYHLQSIVKRFGKKNSAPAKHGTDGVFQRASSGFMGQEWDGGDVAFDPETWSLLGEHLYDGAFGFVFSASRNWHRVAVAIEDAGFIIHPTIFCWVQGQGFPKATRIDKKANDERWSGHRYGLQALKPAVEPIICFQKPYNGKPLDNIIETGAGALNIDGARIPLLSEDDEYVINTFDDGEKPWGDGAGHEYTSRNQSGGRWPANFVLDEETTQKLDRQSGLLQSGKFESHHVIHSDWGYHGGERSKEPLSATYGYSGGASRFFYTVSYNVDEADPIFYCPKASPKEKKAGLDERCKHPTMKPISINQWLATLLLPPDHYENRSLLIPFSGVGSEMIGGLLAGWDRVCGIEMDTEESYVDIAYRRLDYYAKRNNS